LRSVWKGTINFGVVAIPAKLYSATEDKTKELRSNIHQLHAECGSRIQMPKWCPSCNRKVESTELKRGYEVSEGKFIILEEADLQSLPLRSLKQIEVTEFVEDNFDVRYFVDCYYLTCEDTGARAFTLFLKAMEQASLIGVAKLTYREKERLSALRPFDGLILLHTLHYADEIRPVDEIKPKVVAVSEKELELASMLISRMKGEFDPSKYHDDYREALEKLVEARIEGKQIAVEPEKAPVGDVTEALLKSLELAGVK